MTPSAKPAIATIGAAVALCAAAMLHAGSTPQSAAASAEARAVAFLSGEVPRWPAENRCFSCHNNGDAARALYAAIRRGHEVAPAALADTYDWLRRPDAWDDNALGESFSDTVLARIQFTGALVSAIEAGLDDARPALAVAAAFVASDQHEDGAWRLDSSGSIGSPATYGTSLATWAALRALRADEAGRHADAIAKGGTWLRALETTTVLDAASVVLGLGRDTDGGAVAQRRRCLQLIVDGEAPSGGWGAYLASRTEPFDTALVVLALRPLLDAPELLAPTLTPNRTRELVSRGRAFLLTEQLDDGSWVETTRPPGQQSYAQYVSTTGWATMALLETAELP